MRGVRRLVGSRWQGHRSVEPEFFIVAPPIGNKPNRKIIYTTGAGDDIEQEARAKSIMAAWGDLVFKVMKKVTRLDRFKQRLDSARNC